MATATVARFVELIQVDGSLHTPEMDAAKSADAWIGELYAPETEAAPDV